MTLRADQRMQELQAVADGWWREYGKTNWATREYSIRVVPLHGAIPGGGPPVSIGAVTYDRLERFLVRGRQRERLTKKEFSILEILVDYRGYYVSTERIEQVVWGTTLIDLSTADSPVKTHLSHLRTKLNRLAPGTGKHIETRFMLGYRLRAEPAP
jgi:DNA-binding response OmpR family regulator